MLAFRKQNQERQVSAFMATKVCVCVCVYVCMCVRLLLLRYFALCRRPDVFHRDTPPTANLCTALVGVDSIQVISRGPALPRKTLFSCTCGILFNSTDLGRQASSDSTKAPSGQFYIVKLSKRSETTFVDAFCIVDAEHTTKRVGGKLRRVSYFHFARLL